jgi:UDP-2,3-diacylglucosamine hydrolase
LTRPGKIYFASDFHLGLNAGSDPVEREKKVVEWLNNIARDAVEIYLIGDIFDFWWEYKLVVPKGFTRFLGTISRITDSGIPVHFFTGNHDMWMKNYFTEECGVITHTSPVTTIIDGKKFYLAHGEGLGSQSTGYKILLWIFRNKPLRILYSALPPALGIRIGHSWSLHSRLGKGIKLDFMGEEKEDLIKYARSVQLNEKFDFFIFGHRHLGLTFMLDDGAEIVFLGDWVRDGSYAVWDGHELKFCQMGYSAGSSTPTVSI